MPDGELAGLATVALDHDGDVAVARIGGEIDLSNAAELTRRLKAAVGEAGAGLVVDLAATSYLDSAGIRALFVVNRHLAQRRQELRLAVPVDSPLRTVLDLTGVGEVIPVHATVASARARWAAADGGGRAPSG